MYVCYRKYILNFLNVTAQRPSEDATKAVHEDDLYSDVDVEVGNVGLGDLLATYMPAEGEIGAREAAWRGGDSQSNKRAETRRASEVAGAAEARRQLRKVLISTLRAG